MASDRSALLSTIDVVGDGAGRRKAKTPTLSAALQSLTAAVLPGPGGAGVGQTLASSDSGSVSGPPVERAALLSTSSRKADTGSAVGKKGEDNTWIVLIALGAGLVALTMLDRSGGSTGSRAGDYASKEGLFKKPGYYAFGFRAEPGVAGVTARDIAERRGLKAAEGPFDTERQARAAADKLAAIGYPTVVQRVR